MDRVLLTLFACSYLTMIVEAVIGEKNLVVEGAHSLHTLDGDGNFKHPFLGFEHVDSIHYPDSKTFSIRLNQVEHHTPHRYQLK